MLTAVVIRSERLSDNYITLPLGPGTTQDSEGFRGLFLKDATGLGPVEADIHRTPRPNSPGVTYEGFAVGERNAVFTVGLDYDGNNGGTVQDIRRRLYQVLRPGDNVRVGLEFGTTAANLFFTGYVESMQPELFSADPSYQISLIAVDSYMEGAVVPERTGIFNDGTTNSEVIQYDGDAPVGMNLVLQARENGNSSVSVRNRTDSSWFTISPLPIRAWEKLIINSIAGQRTVFVTDSSDNFLYRPLDAIVEGSTWPTLSYGSNAFGLLSTNSNFRYWINHRPIYLGV